jgi:hypothetical protein
VSYRYLLRSVVVLCLFSASWPGSAQATSLKLRLSEVVGSEDSYSADGSPLTFSDFELTSSGAEVDLDLFCIRFDESGFTIKGPLRSRGGEDVDLVLDYVVQADPGMVVSDASLAIRGMAKHGSIGVSETFAEFPDVELSASIDRGFGRVSDLASLGAGAPLLHVSKGILLDTAASQPRRRPSGHGGDALGDACESWHCGFPSHHGKKLSLAFLLRIDQRFEVQAQPIPEPGTGLLVGLGFAGLLAFRARSR